MFDTSTIFGKPAIVFKYTESKCKGTACETSKGRPKVKNFGVALNMYLHGPTNRIALGVNNVKVTNADLGSGQKDSYTDVKLALFYNF